MGILPAIVLEATAHPWPQLSLQDRHGVQSTPGLPLSSVTPRLQISAATTLGVPALSCQGCSDPAGVGAPGQRCDMVRKFSGQRGPQSLFLNCTPLLLLESPCAGPNTSSPCRLCRADVCGPVIAAPSLGVQFGRVPKMLLGPRFLRNRRLLPFTAGPRFAWLLTVHACTHTQAYAQGLTYTRPTRTTWGMCRPRCLPHGTCFSVSESVCLPRILVTGPPQLALCQANRRLKP